MIALDQAQVRAAMTPAEPSLDRIEVVVRLCEDRVRRARAKKIAAGVEHASALIALCHAKAERTAFIAAQTDPQGMLL